jgi:hypothetical protein
MVALYRRAQEISEWRRRSNGKRIILVCTAMMIAFWEEAAASTHTNSFANAHDEKFATPENAPQY